MVRLVFRPYTQIWRSIWTSEPLRASTRVSSGFTLFRHSSPSFGSQQLCSTQIHQKTSGSVDCAPVRAPIYSLSLRVRVLHPNTRIDVRLLGPCFKTGGIGLLRQDPSTKRGPLSRVPVFNQSYNTPKSHILWVLSWPPNRSWPRKLLVHSPERLLITEIQV